MEKKVPIYCLRVRGKFQDFNLFSRNTWLSPNTRVGLESDIPLYLQYCAKRYICNTAAEPSQMYLGGTLKVPWDLELSAVLAGNYKYVCTSKCFFHKIYLLMLFSYFLLFFPFPPNIFIFIFSLIKAAQKVIENTEKFITLTGGRILTEKFTNSIKLKNEWKWDVGRGFFNRRIFIKKQSVRRLSTCVYCWCLPGLSCLQTGLPVQPGEQMPFH